MAYEVGQRVKIVKVNENSDDYEDTKECIGKEGIIRSVLPFEGEMIYDLKCNDDRVEIYFWQESELELIE